MDLYYPFLAYMNYEETYTERYLIAKSSRELICKAVEEGLLKQVDVTDIGVKRYAITQKGKDYCNSGRNKK